MVNKVGGGGMAREAILAAMRSQQQATDQVAGGGMGMPNQVGMQGVGNMAGASGVAPVNNTGGFVEALKDGLTEVTQQVQAAESMPEAVARGEIDEFHDVAMVIKQSDLSFRFALQVRNKLIDAYREVMRMSV